MKAVAIVFASFLSTAAFAGTDLRCWDGTFAYNTMTLLEVDDGMELALQGSTAAVGQLTTAGLAVQLGRREYNRTIFVKYAKDECSISETTGQCRGVRNDDKTNLFLQHTVPDLWGYVTAITAIPVASTHLTVSEHEVQFSIEQLVQGERQRVAKFEFVKLRCNDGWTQGLDPKFPDRLRKHLKGGRDVRN